jgi:hypothetical protein
MSLGSISPHVPQAPIDQRLQARAEADGCWETARTIIGIAALVFSAIAIGVALGPLAAVAAVVSFVLLRGLLSCAVDCCFNPNAHYHNHDLESSRVVHMNDGRHVHTGSGRAGHPPYAPEHRHAPHAGGHVHTARGHAHHGHPGHPGGDGLPPPSGPGGHVHTGRGHAAPHGHPRHPGDDGLPPPSGPGGHVHTGSGRRRG